MTVQDLNIPCLRSKFGDYMIFWLWNFLNYRFSIVIIICVLYSLRLAGSKWSFLPNSDNKIDNKIRDKKVKCQAELVISSCKILSVNFQLIYMESTDRAIFIDKMALWNNSLTGSHWAFHILFAVSIPWIDEYTMLCTMNKAGLCGMDLLGTHALN